MQVAAVILSGNLQRVEKRAGLLDFLAPPARTFLVTDKKYSHELLIRRRFCQTERICLDACCDVGTTLERHFLALGSSVSILVDGKLQAGTLECLVLDPFDRNRWTAGVSFPTPVPGGHKGIVHGHRYFFCEPECGLLVDPESLILPPSMLEGPFQLTLSLGNAQPLILATNSFWELQYWVFKLSEALLGQPPMAATRAKQVGRVIQLASSAPVSTPTIVIPASEPRAEGCSADLYAHFFLDTARAQAETLLLESAHVSGVTEGLFLCRTSRGRIVASMLIGDSQFLHAQLENQKIGGPLDVAAILRQHQANPHAFLSAFDHSVRTTPSPSPEPVADPQTTEV